MEKELKDSFSIKYWDHHCFDDDSVYRLSYHRVFLVKEGQGMLLIDQHHHPVSGNEFFLAAKGQVLSIMAGSRFTAYELCFGDCFWEKAPASASNCKAVLFNNAAANQCLPLNTDDYEELSPLFAMLNKEFEKNDYVNKLDALAAYLKVIMIKMANVNASLTKGHNSYENQVYRQFVELISQQYQISHEVSDYANQLGVSVRKLTALSKRCSGKGAKDTINGQLIAEAKRSLQFSSNPIKEIAYRLNFSSPEQFSHFFKKNTQVSPLDYRTYFVNIGL
jgi:AraC-like DNA-binding protein